MTTANTLNIAKVCVSLTIQAIAQGKEPDLNLSRKIYCAYQSINDIYTDNPNDSTLTGSGNFLFAICGGYAFEAENILSLGGGGVVPSSGSSTGITPFPINHTVTLAESQVRTLQNAQWIGLVDLNSTTTINNNQYTYTVDYTFNSATGTFDFTLCGYLFQPDDKFATGGFMSV